MSNARKAAPFFNVEINGVVKKYCLNTFAFCELEKELKTSIFKGINWADLGINDLRLLLWAGLLSEEPTLNLKQFTEELDMGTLIKCMSVVKEAIEAAMPSSDSTKKK